MNGFVFEFKEKCDTNFINNFKLIEKDEQDELQIFNYSQLHYRNLERLLLQGRATLQRKLLSYSFKYLNKIILCEDELKMKINEVSKQLSIKEEEIDLIKQRAKERQSERGKPSGGQGAPPLEIPKFSAHEIAYNTR